MPRHPGTAGQHGRAGAPAKTDVPHQGEPLRAWRSPEDPRHNRAADGDGEQTDAIGSACAGVGAGAGAPRTGRARVTRSPLLSLHELHKQRHLHIDPNARPATGGRESIRVSGWSVFPRPSKLLMRKTKPNQAAPERTRLERVFDALRVHSCRRPSRPRGPSVSFIPKTEQARRVQGRQQARPDPVAFAFGAKRRASRGARLAVRRRCAWQRPPATAPWFRPHKACSSGPGSVPPT